MDSAAANGPETGFRPDWQGLWAETAIDLGVCPPLTENAAADVAIVGAGYTGLTAALYLTEAGKSVHVLDRHQPGWGCSGRNGGQVNPGIKLDPEAIFSHYGRQDGQRVFDVARATCDEVFALIERHGIDCEAVRPGYVQGGVGRYGERTLLERVRQWQAHGAPAHYLGKREAADLLGTDVYDTAMLHEDGGSVQPLSYARGLAAAAMAAGATISGGAPATAIEQSGREWRVCSEAGSVTAAHVLIGTNGYTDGLWPGLAQAVVPLASVVAATAPLTDNVAKAILPGRHAVSETIRLQVYYRMDAAGRFVIGGRGPVWGRLEDFPDTAVRRTAERYFPALAGADWEHKWGGYVAMTFDHAPKLMRLAPGVMASMGCNGRGLAMSTMFGKQMALEVLGEGAEMPVTGLYRTPFHLFRNIGLSLSIAKFRLQDMLD